MTHRFRILDFGNYDGDSFDLSLDLGFELQTHQRCRIHGIDTPELRGGTDRSKAAGALARDVARAFVRDALADGGALFDSAEYRGKFGRPLGDIVRARDGRRLTEELLGQRLAVPYAGQAKREIAALHQANIRLLAEAGRIA